ncbi:MAG TPA: PD-(D/E)XK nuclease family protein, partial [Spirosoma sp.]|nr:PD-(D/E)XK nuclease family protein [Spirosoma sp.]
QQSDLAGLIVIGTEQTLDTYIDVPLNGHLPHLYSMGHPTLRVRIAGKIDRIEQYGGQIRIVDYKTGSVKLDNKTPKDLADKLLNDGSADKMRQLWLYRYLTLKNIRDYGGLPLNRDIADVYPAGNMPVEAGFYSFRDIPGGFKTNPVRFGEDDTPEQYIQHSEDLLRRIIQRLFDPSEPFRKTDQIETCQYCDFKGICGR